jgi:hypothetical protein
MAVDTYPDPLVMSLTAGFDVAWTRPMGSDAATGLADVLLHDASIWVAGSADAGHGRAKVLLRVLGPLGGVRGMHLERDTSAGAIDTHGDGVLLVGRKGNAGAIWKVV